MEAIKRKRVTRVGSGAWSIYLPKKWIDSWDPAQQEGREVDLHLISNNLLVVPVLQDRSYTAPVPASQSTVRAALLSAYVRGAAHVTLTPREGTFDSDCIAGTRDFLRHLDERLEATVGADAIAFTLKDTLPGTSDDGLALLGLMAGKLRDVVGLAADCVEHHGTDADRTLHSARLLQAIHDEDLSRLFHQTLRRVATLEFPLESVTDFQLLDLAAASMHAMGGQCVRLAATILQGYGLEMADLAYPRADLVKRLGRRPPVPTVAREMVQAYRKPFAAAQALLSRLPPALAKGDTIALRTLADEALAARGELQQTLFEVVVRHWGDEQAKRGARQGFIAYQAGHPLANVLGSLATLAELAVTLLAAKPSPAQAVEPRPPTPARTPGPRGGA